MEAVELCERDRPDRHLLLVEDDADLRVVLCQLLRGNGWTVTAVRDAKSALRQLKVPDVILTDVVLPGMDGLSFVRLIRAHPDLAPVPVILLTARADIAITVEALRAGGDGYIFTPVNADELLPRLDVQHELTCRRNDVQVLAENHVSNLQRALSSNRRIGVAVGVLMASRQLTSQEAFSQLRRVSNESNRKLRDVADEVVLTGSLSLP